MHFQKTYNVTDNVVLKSSS